MAMTLETFADEAIIVPFEEGGRSWDGWDCWGVLYVAYKECLGVELPTYSGEYTSTRRREELAKLIEHRRTDWVEVDSPKPFDAVLLDMMGRPCHVGLMLDDNLFIHSSEKSMTAVEDLRKAPWSGTGFVSKIEGYYRHVSRLD